MGGGVFKVLFIIVILGAGLYVFRSGVVGDLFSFADKLSFGDGIFPSVPKPTSRVTPKQQIGPEVEPPQEKEEEPAPALAPTIDPRSIPAGFTAEDLSPNFKKVKVSLGRNRIVINSVFKGDSGINVSGWFLRSERESLYVPKAVNIYDPSGLALEGDIMLRSGEVLIIYGGTSAIGVNYRLNKCMGYLENTIDFSPLLPRNCPNPLNDFDMSRVTGLCQDYIRSLSSCKMPNTNPPFVPQTDYVCREYLTQINMRGCYERHRGDANFLDNDWRAWTGQTFGDPRHDKILLFDENMKLVNVYSY